ncbi:DegT/DnrJ/EryC1/StrS family aminotransferase [Prochlorococcus marinus]|uniref:DegT/DnrJ/EryC1/StrS family aminotransferase n=1 Tax=Prochlorococcus marinus TaxID=1219 RepID=UPI001ADB5FDA|nr:DegT/DnrJ/EryC1/StrS family aminotransferase [Prochlorococcus marinus]MBO8219516.1 DegT/DnrJ/EryC1/StrS family aminotransferase [Prochlorococcus marinus CUG1416]MBW3051887.1 hypothetical protein [Prochlorococcus marinus str. MU1416]
MGETIPSWTYEYELNENKKTYFDLINKVFDSGRLILGQELENFEKNFSEYIGTNFAIGCDNATNALFLILKSIGIKKGEEVITVANTAIPTVSAIRQSGGTPIFVDVNENALIDINKIKNALTSKTKAIIAVHLYGYPCDIQEIKKLSNQYDITLIEDCSQAHGASFKGKKVGSIGDFSAFSFYPTKPLGAYGDAGIICTNDIDKYQLIKRLRFYGIEKDYVAEVDGFNSRMDEIQAAILNFKLKKLEKNIFYRKNIAEIYYKNLTREFFNPIPIPKYSNCSFYLIPFYFAKNRDDFQEKLKNAGVGTNVSYRNPIHLMKAYRDLGYKKGDLPKTELFCKHNISLPIFDLMPIETTYEVVNRVSKVLDSY